MLTEEQVSIIRQADRNIVELLEKRKNTQTVDTKIIDKKKRAVLIWQIMIVGFLLGSGLTMALAYFYLR
jgi:hypothetical protein